MASGYWAGAAALAGVGAFCFACGDSDDGGNSASTPDASILDSAVQNDAPAPGSPQTVTFETTAHATTLTPVGPANATLAARLEDDGTTWSVLTPTSTGSYDVTTTNPRVTAAFICATDDGNAQIAIIDRAASSGSVAVPLGASCTLPRVKVFELSGTFSHLSADVDWLDFGYANDDRGSSMPVTGTSADYDILNVQQGTWDLVFGFRDDANLPLDDIYIARGQKFEADVVLNADISTGGFVPGENTLTVNGITPGDLMNAEITYQVGAGSHGLPVGPALVLANLKKNTAAYATVPAAMQQPSDRYEVVISTGAENAPPAHVVRGFSGSFHTALDAPLTLSAAPPSFTASVIATPYTRVEFKATARPAATIAFSAQTEVSDRVTHYWGYSTDAVFADGAPIDITLPDLSALPGFESSWAVDNTTDTMTSYELSDPDVTVSDGKLTPYAVRFDTLGK